MQNVHTYYVHTYVWDKFAKLMNFLYNYTVYGEHEN